MAATRDATRASELFQDFALKVMNGEFHRTDPSRGRFRDDLTTALHHLIMSEPNQPHDDGNARGWLYGVLAYRVGAIDAQTLSEALAAQSAGTVDVLKERAGLDPSVHTLVDGLVGYLLNRHAGDAAAALTALNTPTELPNDGVADTLVASDDQVDATRGGDAAHPDGTATPHNTAAPPLFGGRYRVVKLHARGNLGEVYVAHDTELDRDVALKQIRPAHADKAISRTLFEVEARVTGGLDHPGIVPVHSLGRDPRGRPFYAMRFIRGRSLREAIRARFEPTTTPEAAFDLPALVRRFVAACYAVAYAHSRGVVHRDLKPANIMLGDYGETLVVDWGLAKPLGHAADPVAPSPDEPPLPSGSGSADATTPGIKGTPPFMSPEQARGEPVTPASDVYNLGATLYSILTGQPPFSGGTDDVLRAVRAGLVPPPRRVRRDVPRALEAICLKAMALDPAHRHASARDLASDLERWLSDEPVACYRERAAERLNRWARRHRTLVWVLLVALCILAVASVPLAILMRQKDVALRAAELAERQAQTSASAAERARGAAERNFSASRALVSNNLALLTDALAYLPGSEPLRQQLVDTAVAHYERFLREQPGDVPLMREASTVYRTAANIGRLLETDPRRTAGLYRRALALAERVERDAPDRAAKRRVARLLVDRAEWQLGRGSYQAAENDLSAALNRLYAGVPMGEGPDDHDDRQVAAIAWLDLAAVELEKGRWVEAAAAANQSEVVLRPMAGGAQGTWIDRLMHAASLVTLARALRERGQLAEAETALAHADDRVRALAGDEPSNIDIEFNAGLMHLERARLALALRRWGQARSAADAAMGVLQGLADRHSAIGAFRRSAVEALILRAEARLGAGRPLAAQADALQALWAVEPEEGRSFAGPDQAALAGAARAVLGRADRLLGCPVSARLWLDAAIAHFEGVLRVAPDRFEARSALQRLRTERGQVGGWAFGPR